MNTKRTSSWKIMWVSILAIILSCYIFLPIGGNSKAYAFESETAVRYSDDGTNDDSGITPYGQGVTTNDNRHFFYDYRVGYDSNRVYTAPSYGNTDNTMHNVCGPMAGTNIVGYYDRWNENLIPNFFPGMINGNYYEYFPDLDFPAIKDTIRSMYTIMDTNVSGPGTTQSDFQNGLTAYANNRGYSLSYSSFYNNATTVNLNTLATAIAANKVGVIFCNTFNYVYSICEDSLGKETMITKINSTAAHIMMVYGYRTITYYRNGVNFQTDTYLQVSSGFSTADIGYVQMNDYLGIMDALIVNVS